MVATVKVMSAGLDMRADHRPYIAAVCRSIEAREIRVVAAGVTRFTRRVRKARLMLRPEQDAFAEAGLAPARAAWDEGHGWSLSAWRESISYQISKGLDVVPDPDDVAAWVVVALAHPELTPSYEHGPLRAHSVSDPEFEARLARYAATG